jgi:hypothetical protein
MLDRPYRIYRHGRIGRTLHDTQCTQEAAKAAIKTGEVEYPGERFEIEYRECPFTPADRAEDSFST